MTKITELTHIEEVHLCLFYLAVNKLITDKNQNIFFIAEYSGFLKYTLKKPNWIT